MLVFVALPKTFFDMIGSIVSAVIGGAVQIGSTIYGQKKSAEQNAEAQRELDLRRTENKEWYNRKMNEDYLSRSDVQNTLRKQRELLQEQYKRSRATNVVAGGTDESLALQQREANRVLGETTAEIASHASAYKDSIEQQYRNAETQLSQQQQQIYGQQADATAKAAGRAAATGSQLLAGGLEGISEAVSDKAVAKEIKKVDNN